MNGPTSIYSSPPSRAEHVPALSGLREASGDLSFGPAPPSAVVVAGDEETRVLLRGLLKLHRFRVVGEASGASQADELVRLHRPTVLVADATLVEGSLGRLFPAARDASPGTRIILIQPNARPPPLEPPAVPDATLVRPFRVRDFIDALSGTNARRDAGAVAP